MLRRQRLAPPARVVVRSPDEPRAGLVSSDSIIEEGSLCYEVSFDGGGCETIPDADVTPELPGADRPDASFLAELTDDRRQQLTSVARRALKKLGELYHEDIHLIEELLQNAEDAEALELTFTITAEGVVARNNGLPFSRRDIAKITDVLDERSKELGQIGRHGIGFRSVYAITDRPRIISGSVAFAIEDYLVPVPVNAPGLLPAWGTTFELPFKTPTAKTGQPFPAFFVDQLARFNARTLLFLRNVWRLCVMSQAEPQCQRVMFKTEEEDARTGGLLVQLYFGGDTAPSETWLVFRDPPSGEVTNAVEVAFRLRTGELDPCADGLLYVFLPTKMPARLPFVINGDFTPTKPRDGIIEDDPQNWLLMERMGHLVAEAAPRLRAVGRQPARLLAVLPRRCHADTAMLEPLIRAAHEGLRMAPIVPIRGGGWATPEEALLLEPDDAVLGVLLTDEDLSVISGRPRALVTLPPDIRTDARELLIDLGVEIFEPSRLRPLLTAPQRLVGRGPAWFANLYRYLGHRARVWGAQLRGERIVLGEDGELHTAEEGILLPLTEETEQEIVDLFGDRCVFVHREVVWPPVGARSDGERAIDFLKSLGVQHLSHTKIIEEWLLPAFTVDPRPIDDLLDRYTDFLRRHLEEYRREKQDKTPVLTTERILESVRVSLRLRERPQQARLGATYRAPTGLLLASEYRDDASGREPADVVGVPEVDTCYLHLGEWGHPSDARAAWREFLLAMGVQETLDPLWVIDHVILPRHQSDAWKQLSATALIDDLDLIRRHATPYQETKRQQKPAAERTTYSAYRELGKALWIRTQGTENGQSHYSHAPALYLPAKAQIRVNFELIFPESVVPRNRFVHEQYFGRKTSQGEQTWTEFLVSLGACNRLQVLPLQRTQKDWWDRSRYQDPRREEGGWPSNLRHLGGIEDDWHAPDLAKLFEVLSSLPWERACNIVRLLLGTLEDGWTRGEPVAERYRSKTRCYILYDLSYQRRDIDWQRYPWPSEFEWLLRKSKWLPTTFGDLGSPEEVYVDTPENRLLLGRSRPLLAVPLPSQDSEFVRAMRFQREPTVDAVLDHLGALATAEEPPPANLVTAIYRYLAKQLAAEGKERNEPDLELARQWFATKPLLYLPDTARRWWPVTEVFFRGPQGVFGDRRAYLCIEYPRLVNLFTALGVPEAPSLGHFIRFLACDVAAMADQSVRLSMAGRVCVAASRLIQEQEVPTEDSPETPELRSLACLPCEDGVLRAAADVWVNDDPIAHAALQTNLMFLALPGEVPLADVQELLDWLQVRPLSASVRRCVARYVAAPPSGDLQRRIPRAVDLAQRWLFHNYPTRHETAFQQGVYEMLARLQVAPVAHLQVTYAVDLVASVAPADVVVLPEEPKLYYRPGTADLYVGSELARLFGTPKGLAEFLSIALATATSGNGLGEFLARTGVPPLPPGAQRWQPQEAQVSTEEQITTAESVQAVVERAATEWVPTGPSEVRTEQSSPDPASVTREVGPSATEDRTQDTAAGGAPAAEDHVPVTIRQRTKPRSVDEALPTRDHATRTYGEQINAAWVGDAVPVSGAGMYQPEGSLGLPIEAIFEQGPQRVAEVSRKLQERIANDRQLHDNTPRRAVTYEVTGRRSVLDLDAFLHERYRGRCQICGDSFQRRDGQPFFIRHHILPWAQGGFDSEANVLCLCPKHHCMLRFARCQLDLEDALREPVPDETGMVRVAIQLAGKPAHISFTLDHHWPFVELCRMPVPD